jgi:hypothetical protein
MDRLPTEEDPVEDRTTYLSDRRGLIVVPSDPDNPLRHALVHSGGAVLASVPLIPGLEHRMALELPDDRARLNVEGELAMMEDDLIDAVASRSVIMTRARGAARAERWDDVDVFLEELNGLPDFAQFDRRLNAVRLPAEQTARQLGDRVAQSRIVRLCREFREIAEVRLSGDVIRDFETEMNQLRTVQQ